MRNFLWLVVASLVNAFCLLSFAGMGGGSPVPARSLTSTGATAAELVTVEVERETQPVPETNGLHPGEVRMHPSEGQRYVWIPPGSFQMGCSADDRYCQDEVVAIEEEFTNEKPRHGVVISRGFWMG